MGSTPDPASAEADGAPHEPPLRVAYMASARLAHLSDQLPVHRDRSSTGRSELIHTLAWHRGLLSCPDAPPGNEEEEEDEATAFRKLVSKYEETSEEVCPPPRKANRARVIFPRPLTPREACLYHDPSYVRSLLAGDPPAGPPRKKRKTLRTTAQPGPAPKPPSTQAIAPHALAIAGASIAAAELLRSAAVDVAIAFDGGRHHAHKAAADGYCYLNDIVLAIQALRRPVRRAVPAGSGTGRRLDRVAYIDLDLHWGDGVEEAFLSNPSVMTLSMHHAAPGFYPPAPYVVGAVPVPGGTTPHALRLPLDLGTSDQSVHTVWEGVDQVLTAFGADAYVVQLGADGNAADPHGIWNLSSLTYQWCVQRILQRRKPTLLLGGGGYDVPSTALIWTGVLATVLGADTEAEVPRSLPSDLGIWSRLHNILRGEIFTPSSGTSHLSDAVRMGHSWSVQAGMRQDQNPPSHLRGLILALSQAAELIREATPLQTQPSTESREDAGSDANSNEDIGAEDEQVPSHEERAVRSPSRASSSSPACHAPPPSDSEARGVRGKNQDARSSALPITTNG